MPKKESAKKRKLVFRSKEEIQRLMSEVSAARAAGSTLTAVLKKLNVSDDTYFTWRQKYEIKPVPVAKEEKTKVKQRSKFGNRYTEQQKDAFRKEDRNLKSQGKTDGQVAKALGISTTTLYAFRKSAKKVVVKGTTTGAKPKIQLSPNNPLYQIALAHERLIRLNEEIAKLEKEKAEIVQKMDAMMEKAAEVCPGLRGGKK